MLAKPETVIHWGDSEVAHFLTRATGTPIYNISYCSKSTVIMTLGVL